MVDAELDALCAEADMGVSDRDAARLVWDVEERERDVSVNVWSEEVPKKEFTASRTTAMLPVQRCPVGS